MELDIKRWFLLYSAEHIVLALKKSCGFKHHEIYDFLKDAIKLYLKNIDLITKLCDKYPGVIVDIEQLYFDSSFYYEDYSPLE